GRDVLRRLDNKTCDGNDRQASGEENPGVRLRPSVLKDDGDRDKQEQPIDRHVRSRANCVDRSAVVTFSTNIALLTWMLRHRECCRRCIWLIVVRARASRG